MSVFVKVEVLEEVCESLGKENAHILTNSKYTISPYPLGQA